MMDRDRIDVTVRGILGHVLKREVLPAEEVSRANEPLWDSLKNVEVIFSVEDAFGIRFDEDQLSNLTSVSALVQAVEDADAS